MQFCMNGIKIKRASAAVIALVSASTGAVAQEYSYQAEHAANVRAIQAQRDQHAANVAALHGDYGAANAFGYAAAVRSAQSRDDARYARHLRYYGY